MCVTIPNKWKDHAPTIEFLTAAKLQNLRGETSSFTYSIGMIHLLRFTKWFWGGRILTKNLRENRIQYLNSRSQDGPQKKTISKWSDMGPLEVGWNNPSETRLLIRPFIGAPGPHSVYQPPCGSSQFFPRLRLRQQMPWAFNSCTWNCTGEIDWRPQKKS